MQIEVVGDWLVLDLEEWIPLRERDRVIRIRNAERWQAYLLPYLSYY